MSRNSRTMTSFNPYIFRAFYDWLVDNQITPHLVVNADKPKVEVPREYVNHHTIILSISPQATRDFHIGTHGITFSARFSGQERFVSVPFQAMQELFAVETSMSYPIGLWMGMQEDETADEPAADDRDPAAKDSAEEESASFATVEFTGGDSAGSDDSAAAGERENKNEPLPSFTLVGKN